MRPGRAQPPTLTRRALVVRLAGGAAAAGCGTAAGPAAAAAPAPDPDLRDAALRGLALAACRGDPVAAAAADAALARLAGTDPEAALLARLYRLLDVLPAAYWPHDAPRGVREAAAGDLAILHAAIRASRPVAFGYTDLSRRGSARVVLPLALVHPPQGVKLLGWCETAAGYRQFFVRAIEDLTPQPGDFGARRLALLEGLVAKEAGED
ncbi:WYL domain-containing protein [Amaricoccus sp.]|uniref:WYL domain-containing protein n=1 Tax=Amaricoccus sp. TaxID=1872485 RepID=UPI001B5A21D5|nr:WYL domain-containing protein [Amaricoccus sp.]MBP7001795.1 WYL domain-containing protein [Amaricoccus sp.]